jgi:hypothetical protein
LGLVSLKIPTAVATLVIRSIFSGTRGEFDDKELKIRQRCTSCGVKLLVCIPTTPLVPHPVCQARHGAQCNHMSGWTGPNMM